MPFMPDSASRMWAQLGMDGSVADAAWDAEPPLRVPPGHRLGEVHPLFSKVEAEDIERQKSRLGRS